MKQFVQITRLLCPTIHSYQTKTMFLPKDSLGVFVSTDSLFTVTTKSIGPSFACLLAIITMNWLASVSHNAIVDIRRFRHRNKMTFFLLSVKLIELAASKFTAMYLSIVFTFWPEYRWIEVIIRDRERVRQCDMYYRWGPLVLFVCWSLRLQTYPETVYTCSCIQFSWLLVMSGKLKPYELNGLVFFWCNHKGKRQSRSAQDIQRAATVS